MISNPPLPPYVDKIGSDRIRVSCVESKHTFRLMELGFNREKNIPKDAMVCRYTDTSALPALLVSLRDLGIAYSPFHKTAEVFQRLRDAGKVRGTFVEVDWPQPGYWVVTTR